MKNWQKYEMKNWQKWLSWGCIRSGIVHRYFFGLIWNWFCCQSFGDRSFKTTKRTKNFLTASSSWFVIWNVHQEFGSKEFKLGKNTPTINSRMQKSCCQQAQNWKHKCCFIAFHLEGSGLHWQQSDLSSFTFSFFKSQSLIYTKSTSLNALWKGYIAQVSTTNDLKKKNN